MRRDVQQKLTEKQAMLNMVLSLAYEEYRFLDEDVKNITPSNLSNLYSLKTTKRVLNFMAADRTGTFLWTNFV